ncbi:HEAT repeat domain-containing protein [Armatimonas sp.]|uniref:HEAT repeat domain-containing protein n=1 Tax=Armatimonas sp. TaxID=1872638 RepID=UPI003750AFD8
MALSLEGVDDSVVRERIQHLKHHPDWDERICRFIANQLPERAAFLVREAILKPESPYEKWLFRDVRLASRCLKDFLPTPEISLLRDELGLRFLPLLLDHEEEKTLHYCDGLRELVWEVLPELKSRAIVVALVGHCKSHYADTRLNAAKALAKLGDERGVEALIALCLEKDEEDSVARQFATMALGELCSASEPVLATLVALCQEGDGETNVRNYAIQALGNFGVASPEVVDVLTGLCQSEKGYSKIEPMHALAKLGDERSIAALIALCQGEQPLVSLWRDFLEEITEEASIRRLAAELLGKLGEPHGLAELTSLCQDAKVRTNIQLYSAEVLAQRGDRRGVDVLVELCQHPDKNWCLGAAKALAKLGNERGIETLVALSNFTAEGS